MRKLLRNNFGSSDPIIITIIILGVAAFAILIFSEILVPFMQLLQSTESSVDPVISAPRGYFTLFVSLLWPKGVMLIILIVILAVVLMEYQKSKFKES